MVNPESQNERPERPPQVNSRIVHISDILNKKECIEFFDNFNKYKN